ncbi:putative quinol monooxygenase [Rhizobium leguminosarum]|uniref:putative quinol monooxygenase n=1 Tax=Rhizobium leguminosarum TaxID=384 RepID=UPI003F9524AE
MSQQLTVIAHLVTRPEKIDEAKTAMLSLIEKTRSEDGCLDYDLHQGNENPMEFTFYEIWKNRQAWEEHMEMSYLKEFVARGDEFFEIEPKILFMAMISARR